MKMEPKMIDEKKKLLAKLERKEKILAKRLNDVREIISVLKSKKQTTKIKNTDETEVI